MTSKQVYGIVLAGGKSRRMGRDKALIELHGKPLIQHAVDSLRSCTDSCVVVAGNVDDYTVDGAETLADIWPDIGPIGGLYTGLKHFGQGRCIVIGCDMPAVRPELLNLLLSAMQPTDDAAAVMIDNHLQPLCAVYAHVCLDRLQLYLESGGRAVKGALKAIRTRIIDAEIARTADPDLRSFLNVNTAEDLVELKHRLEL